MTKKATSLLWIVFILVVPVLYILMKKVILPNTQSVEMIMVFAPYLFSIVTVMYKIDERFYFMLKRITQWFLGTYSSWCFSTRYYKINEPEKILEHIQNGLTNEGCNIIKKEQNYFCVFWKSKNMLHFRVDNMGHNEYSLHFYTSIIDVPFRSMRTKTQEFTYMFEKIENNINMVDRSRKTYEIKISYPNSSPYYSFWIKTLRKERLIKFDCKINTDSGIINVSKNEIRYSTSMLQDLFQRVENYLNLRGN